MRERVLWVDVAKGLGILLVVFGHVWRGLESGGQLDDPTLFGTVDRAIYLFHMPLFFFLSGLFFRAGGPATQRVQRLAISLLYPLVIWSYATAVFKIIAGGLANSPAPSVAEALTYPFPPRDIYWFLWALFLIQVSTLFISMLPAPFRAAAYALVPLLCFLYILGGQNYPLVGEALEHWPFFLVGVLLGSRSREFDPGVAVAIAAAAAFAGAQVYAITNAMPLVGAADLILGMTATLGFCCLIAWLGPRLPRVIADPVARLGSLSMPVYLAHVIALAATRVLLSKLGINDLWIHVAAGIAAGVGGPLLLYLAVRRLNLAHLVGFASWPRPRMPAFNSSV